MEKQSPQLIVNAIVLRYDNVLLRKREIEGEDQWVFPGAELFKDEPLLTHLGQVVEHQTGYHIDNACIYQVYDVFPKDSDAHWVVMDFEAKLAGGELKVGEGVLDVAWVSNHAAKLMPIEKNTLELLVDLRIFDPKPH